MRDLTLAEGSIPISVDDARECAKGDPILQSMIDKGLPLTRNKYLSLALDGYPEEWTAEDELALPECFQQPR